MIVAQPNTISQRRRSNGERVVVITLALTALVSGFYFAGKSGSNPDAYSNDFNVYYHASREIIAGRDPYQHSLGDWTPYIYPPLLAELIIPLAVLPLPIAAYVWFLISAASVVAAATMSASLVSGDSKELNERIVWRWAIAGCAVMLVLRFVLDTFNLGQVNAIVAALAVAHIYFYARDRKGLSALALVVAISIKLTPALFLVYHIAKLRLKFAAACAALLFALTAASFLPFGPSGVGGFQTFWDRTVKNKQGYNFAYSGNQSLRGVIARAKKSEAKLPDEDESRKPEDLATIVISVALLALATFSAVRARSEIAAAAPFFCGMVLFSPLSWKAHYVSLILPAAWQLYLAKTSARARLVLAATLGAAFVLFNLTSPRVIGLPAAEWADGHSLAFVGGLLILIASLASNRTFANLIKQPR